MSHLIYSGIVEVSNLGTEFNASANPIVLNLDPTITKLPSGALKANVVSSLAGTTLTQNGSSINLLPAIKAGETLTTIAYNPVTKIITYTGENGTPVAIDLSALATDIYITGSTYDVATMVLTLTDNSATTPDITLNLAELKKVATAASPSVTFSGTGEASSPLTATVIALPAGVVIPAAQLTGAVPAAVMTTSTTNTIAWTKAAGATNTTNGVAANLGIPSAVIAEVLGYSVAGTPVWETKAAFAGTLSIGAAQLTPGALGVGVTIPASQVTGQTNTLAISKAGGAVNTTNGIVATQSIPVGTAVDVIGYNAAGTPVNQSAATLPIAPSQLTAGTLPATVLVSAASLPATTHVNGWTKAGGLTESVNGVASNIAIVAGTVVDVIGYNAAGTPVNAPIVRQTIVRELYATTGVTYSQPGPTVVSDSFADVYSVVTLIELTAAVAITIAVPPATISAAMIGIEIDIKTTGVWVGDAIINAAPSIDGAASFTLSKTAATRQPSISIRWTGSKWLIV